MRNGSRRPLRRRLIPYGLLGPGAIWLVLFFVVPMYFMGELALRSGSFTEGFTFTWEWANFPDALEGRGGQLVRTFIYSGTATILALLIAYPLAYAIAVRASPRWRLLLLFAVIAPFFTTYLIRTIAWKTILSDSSPIVDVLQALTLIPDDGRVLATSGAVIAGLTYNFLPFMILPIYASLERIDRRLIEAGKDLYGGPWQTFRHVTWPHTLQGVLAGSVLVFLPSVGDFVAAQLLGGPDTYMVGNLIQDQFFTANNWPFGAALTVVMMIFLSVWMVGYLRSAARDARAAM